MGLVGLAIWVGESTTASMRFSELVGITRGEDDGRFDPADLSEKRLQLVRDTCAAYERQSGYTVTPRFVDARIKESASKL